MNVLLRRVQKNIFNKFVCINTKKILNKNQFYRQKILIIILIKLDTILKTKYIIGI